MRINLGRIFLVVLALLTPLTAMAGGHKVYKAEDEACTDLFSAIYKGGKITK